jgi:hypothetical protein
MGFGQIYQDLDRIAHGVLLISFKDLGYIGVESRKSS